MNVTLQLASICALVVVFVLAAPPLSVVPSYACSADDRTQLPCMCCKKDCWYSIAAAATHELGHVPGEAGEREALATLHFIRACMQTDCAAQCMFEQAMRQDVLRSLRGPAL
uniref:Uncharacterized protein n=1 Tax=Angiostrongylus cantonensis TaxID=6313 RepID=A0A158P7T2_ANGCA